MKINGTWKQSEKTRFRVRRHAAIIESFLAFFILLLIFCGLLQIYKLVIADMVVEYAAFRGARTSSVGFDDYLVQRHTQIITAPISGDIEVPVRRSDYSDIQTLVTWEKKSAEDYFPGERYLTYEYWRGETGRHNNYKCPNYGKEMTSGTCSICTNSTSHLSISQSSSGDTTSVTVYFKNYPLTMPMYEIFSQSGMLNIEKSVEMTNHADTFLE